MATPFPLELRGRDEVRVQNKIKEYVSFDTAPDSAPLPAESCNWMFSPESFGTVG
jgi:hypothetical protein